MSWLRPPSKAKEEAERRKLMTWRQVMALPQPVSPVGVAIVNTGAATSKTAKQDCHVCGVHTRNLDNLRKHLKKFHAKRGRCKVCGLVVHDKASLPEHLRTEHDCGPEARKCGMCSFVADNKAALELHGKLKHVSGSKFSSRFMLQHCREVESGEPCDACFVFTSQLRQHLHQEHGVAAAEDVIHERFSNIEEFYSYKAKFELETGAVFNIGYGRRNNTLNFMCNRSGKHKPLLMQPGQRQRRQRSNGSIKIGFNCTAGMKVTFPDEGGVALEVYPFHYGHTCGDRPLPTGKTVKITDGRSAHRNQKKIQPRPTEDKTSDQCGPLAASGAITVSSVVTIDNNTAAEIVIQEETPSELHRSAEKRRRLDPPSKTESIPTVRVLKPGNGTVNQQTVSAASEQCTDLEKRLQRLRQDAGGLVELETKLRDVKRQTHGLAELERQIQVAKREASWLAVDQATPPPSPQPSDLTEQAVPSEGSSRPPAFATRSRLGRGSRREPIWVRDFVTEMKPTSGRTRIRATTAQSSERPCSPARLECDSADAAASVAASSRTSDLPCSQVTETVVERPTSDDVQAQRKRLQQRKIVQLLQIRSAEQRAKSAVAAGRESEDDELLFSLRSSLESTRREIRALDECRVEVFQVCSNEQETEEEVALAPSGRPSRAVPACAQQYRALVRAVAGERRLQTRLARTRRRLAAARRDHRAAWRDTRADLPFRDELPETEPLLVLRCPEQEAPPAQLQPLQLVTPFCRPQQWRQLVRQLQLQLMETRARLVSSVIDNTEVRAQAMERNAEYLRREARLNQQLEELTQKQSCESTQLQVQNQLATADDILFL